MSTGPIEPGSEIDKELLDLLSKAGWQLHPAPDWVMKSRDPRVGYTLSATFGISVDFDQTQSDRFKTVAKALANALADEGVAADSREVPDRRWDRDTIGVLISP
jgi:hypothetical protein